ncbi:MAG: AMP-binding protein [Gammaproteobacteria bacterium]|nr:AMP-binding protein [Gammaproteobacteria bacterium]
MIFDLAAWRGALTPDRPAVWDGTAWLTYRALDCRATRLAQRLHAQGVRKGDRVGILAPNHLLHLDSLLAAPKLGFVHTPYNYRLTAEELRRLLAEAAPKLLFVDDAMRGLLHGVDTTVVELATYDDWLGRNAPPFPRPALDDDDVWMMLFTGGSTGTPKGALIPYRQVLANAVNTIMAWGVTADDCAIQATPMFHAGVNVLATPLLYAGGRLVLLAAFEPGAYLSLAEMHRVTLCFMVPTMYQLLADDPAFDGTDLSAVRWAICGGAPCAPLLRDTYAARGVLFKLGYGLTEAGVNCFAIDAETARARPDSVGLPMPLLRAAIRRPDGTEAVADEIGELTLAGPAVFSGYHERPEETTRVLRDGWLWTGDLARRDAGGCFQIVGRRKEMYISGGENVYPAEIEAALSQHPAVAECAVLGIPHPQWGETGLAAIVLTPGRLCDSSQLRTWLTQHLAGYKLPREFLFLQVLPKTAAGKINKPEILRVFERRHKKTGKKTICGHDNI